MHQEAMTKTVAGRTTDLVPRAKVVMCGDGCANVILETHATLERGANIDLVRSVRRPGGNALVTALALARWDVEVAYIGVVGEDDAGRELVDWMQRVGVVTEAVVRRGNTRTSYAIVDDGERTILDERGSSGELGPDDWRANPAMERIIRESDVISLDRYCAGIHAFALAEVEKRRKLGEKPALVYRTGSRHSEGLEIERKVFPAADVCITKRPYLDGLGLKGDPQDACRRLSAQFRVPSVVATLGKEGAAYYDGHSGRHGIAPAVRVERPGTTLGGGDWFRAGLIFGLLRGEGLAESVRWGNRVAAEHCSRPESSELPSLFFSLDEMV